MFVQPLHAIAWINIFLVVINQSVFEFMSVHSKVILDKPGHKVIRIKDTFLKLNFGLLFF